MNKYSLLLAILIGVFSTKSIQAQDTKDSISSGTTYQKGKEYILGGIVVTGLKKFKEPTVKIFTGLKDGQVIKNERVSR